MVAIERLSEDYDCQELTEVDIPAILNLYESNPLYFHYCPPMPSLDSVREDMEGLPNGKNKADKFFVGFWDGAKLVAVMDFAYAYPDKQMIFIGLFMVNQSYQGKGLGSQLMAEALADFSKVFQKVRLAYVKGNLQAQHFWEKQGFLPTGVEVKQDLYTVVTVEKSLGYSDDKEWQSR